MANGIGMGLMNPAEVGQGWQNAMLTGMEQRRQKETRDAFRDYATNPTMEGANAVTQHDPALGLQLRGMQETREAAIAKQRAEEQERLITAAALRGDPQAREQLAYYNSKLYLDLDDRQQDRVDEMMEAVAQQAFSILQLPEPQQGPALQQALAAMQQQGVDVGQFQLSGNPKQDLMAALAVTGQLDDWERFSQVDYEQVGPGGLVGFKFGQPLQQGGQVQNFAPTAKQIGDQTFYQDPNTGKWYDNPADIQGGTAGNGGGSFPGN